jgi:hypothetical protein
LRPFRARLHEPDPEAYDDLERRHFPLTLTLVSLVVGGSVASAIVMLME